MKKIEAESQIETRIKMAALPRQRLSKNFISCQNVFKMLSFSSNAFLRSKRIFLIGSCKPMEFGQHWFRQYITCPSTSVELEYVVIWQSLSHHWFVAKKFADRGIAPCWTWIRRNLLFYELLVDIDDIYDEVGLQNNINWQERCKNQDEMEHVDDKFKRKENLMEQRDALVHDPPENVDRWPLCQTNVQQPWTENPERPEHHEDDWVDID